MPSAPVRQRPFMRCCGREAAFAFAGKEVPTEATIVAIVDEVQKAQ